MPPVDLAQHVKVRWLVGLGVRRAVARHSLVISGDAVSLQVIAHRLAGRSLAGISPLLISCCAYASTAAAAAFRCDGVSGELGAPAGSLWPPSFPSTQGTKSKAKAAAVLYVAVS